MFNKRINKQCSLGDLGELAIKAYYDLLGESYTRSDNPYDSVKDATNARGTVEVKTQVPFINKDAFSIKENQFNKVMSATTVYFVSAPTDRPYKDDGCIYECLDPSKLEWFTEWTRDNRKMILYPRSQKGLTIVHRIDTIDILNQMMEHSSSKKNWTK